MLILSNEQIEGLLTIEECMAVLREMYCDYVADRTLTTPRTDCISPCSYPDAYHAFKQMGGVWPRRHLAALRINSDIVTHPKIGNSIRRVKAPAANGRYVGLVQLYDTETGELLAMFPDGVTQKMRVGATNGLGIEFMARKDARRAGMIGAGWQATAQLAALVASRHIEDIKLYSTRKESREAFVHEARERGINIRAVDTAEECAADVDILMAATSSMKPVIEPSWLRPGMHLSCIKVNEVSQAVLDKCDKVAIHNKADGVAIQNILPGTPHVSQASSQGWWSEGNPQWTKYLSLPHVVAEGSFARESDAEITCLINNVGLGLQFAALSTVILDKARRLGLGTELPREWFSETVHP